jgi:hypothetical protein
MMLRVEKAAIIVGKEYAIRERADLSQRLSGFVLAIKAVPGS